jgi:hypothetical protein
MPLIQYIPGVFSVVLQVLVLRELLRGLYKRLPVMMAYVLAIFFANVVGFAALAGAGKWTRDTVKYYWTFEVLHQGLIFAMVITFIYQAWGQRSDRRSVRLVLVAVSLGWAAFSLAVHQGVSLSRWMTTFSRDMGFGAIVLNLILWRELFRQRSRLLLSISAGLGVQMAGDAIGHAFRQLSPATVHLGNFVLLGAHLLCFVTWWRALRTENLAMAAARAAQGTSPA